MAKKVINSINEQIFSALKIAENSGVPALFISNPGVGKSTTVEMFAKIRGYHLMTLRGNSTTSDEICGYDTVPEGVREGTHRAAVPLRPSWFNKIMEVSEAGGKSLLFLDEITTASTQVQEALLHIIFERSCKDESLPEDTLIVAAGNYAQNLDSTAILLAPVMNRFMIFNLIPSASDISTFLNRYAGAAVNKDHKPNDKMGNLKKMLEEIDKQEVSVDESQYYRIGEFFEKAVENTINQLVSSGKEVDWSVTDLGSIYSGDTSVRSKLYGFVTLRTLGYLRDWAFSTYKCFGIEGIKSDNFKNAVDGLCGIGVSCKTDTETKTNYVGKFFTQMILSCVQDIEKMNNSALPEYESFFTNLLDRKTGLNKEDLVAFNSKIRDLTKDESLQNIERPIKEDLIDKFSKIIIVTSNELKNKLKVIKTGTLADLDGSTTPEAFGGYIETWNLIADLTNSVTSVVSGAKYAYKPKETTLMSTTIENLSQAVLMKIRRVKKLMTALKPGIVLPDIHTLLAV